MSVTLSGVAAAVKQINPACKVYAVEPEGANSLGQSLSSGAPVKLDAVRTIADSLGAPGCLPFSFRVNQAYVDEANSVKRPSYTLVDFYGSFKVTDNAKIFFTVDNAFDKAYFVAGSGTTSVTDITNGRGRTIMIGATTQF